jgi:hypothetical protein
MEPARLEVPPVNSTSDSGPRRVAHVTCGSPRRRRRGEPRTLFWVFWVALTTEEMEVELGLGSSRAWCDVVSRLRGTLGMLYGTTTYLLGPSTTRGTMTHLHAVLV